MNNQDLLMRLGITPNYMGYHLANTAIRLAKESPESLLMVTKLLYPAVGKRHHVTWQAVERDLRTVINLAWKYNPTLLRRLAGFPLPHKPTVAQFISILASVPEDPPGPAEQMDGLFFDAP